MRTASRFTLSMSLLAATAALAIAGCGGDDDTSSSTTAGASGATGASGAPLSQSDFESQANAVCADANSQIEALPAPTNINDLSVLGDYANEVVKIATPLIPKLEAIVPPADQQSQWQDFIDAVQKSTDLDQQLAQAASSGDKAQVKSLANELNATDPSAIAKQMGLTECAKNAQPQG